MWTRKDFMTVAVAAVATFGLAVAILLPGVAHATDDAAVTRVISPVFKTGDCEVTAEAAGRELPVAKAADGTTSGVAVANARGAAMAGMPGAVNLSAGPAPTIKLTIKNPTDKEAKAVFTAKLMTSSMFSGGRVLQIQQEKWAQAYDMTLKPGETREVEVDTKVALGLGTYGQLVMQSGEDAKMRISALTFNVMGPAAAKAAVKDGASAGVASSNVVTNVVTNGVTK